MSLFNHALGRCLLGASFASVLAVQAQAADGGVSGLAVDTEIKLTTDQRTRGISDSLRGPGLKLSVQAAHESGLVGLAEFSTVSTKQFPEGSGVGVTLAGGYRFGNPDGWHFGAGLATEFFPGASFEAPHAFDPETGAPGDVRRGNYNSSFAVLEVGYGALEMRALNVISKTYRGANTGSVCGTMLNLMADPTQALECYARGDQGSRGTWLLDVDYKFNLNPATVLTLHAGRQKVANFAEADFTDYRIGLTHKRWGFDWNADWVTTRTRVRELYLVQDGSSLRATDNSRLVLSVARKF